ncbi:hypothetical protein QM565_17080 [Geitlerinema splendidum]|nr:hypothetical protein [Geitlerinema splendidum]
MHLYQQDHGDFPIGKPYHEELTRYLGGQWIEPPLSIPISKRSFKIQSTYNIHAYRNSPHFRQIERECFDIRGGDMPIVSDFNWATPEQIALTKGGFYLYIRLNGSIGKESGDIPDRLNNRPSDFPCPGSPIWANFK